MSEQFSFKSIQNESGAINACSCDCHRQNCSCDCNRQVTFYEQPRKFPHRCPVCGGAGKIPNINTGTTTSIYPKDACHGCGGTGIVWG